MKKWMLFTPGNYQGTKSFRGKMGLVRTLRSDETIIAFGEDEEEVNFTKVLGRCAWRFPEDKEAKLLLNACVEKLNQGIEPDLLLEKIERYWGE